MKLPRFWKKEEKSKKEESFDSELLEVDFFCQLAYMAAIATSGISRSGLFYHAAKLPYTATRFFRRVDFVAKMFNHDYSQACRIVGEKVGDSAIKALLLRLSGALSSGEDMAGFLSRESSVLSHSYSSSYERRLDILKKWSDAYVALILSSALVTVMAVVTMMIGNVTIPFILSMAVVTIGVTVMGVWFLYRTAPRETKNHSLSIRSREQDLARNLSKLVFPVGGFVVLLMVIMQASIGSVFLVASAFLVPVGLVVMVDDRKVTQRDADIAAFLRSLGGVTQAIGATAAEALSRLDFRSLGVLKEDVSLLHRRLVSGINPDSCWRRFVGESGSELINRSVTTFWDGISLGGEPQEVGNEASAFALKVSLLRAQRSQIAAGFTWLTVAMHGVLVSLAVFVHSVFLTFFALIQSLMPSEDKLDGGAMAGMAPFGLFTLDSRYLDFLHFMVMAIVFILTVANAFAMYSVGGGHPRKLIFYLALTGGISGIVLLAAPSIAGMLFGVL